MSAEFTIILLNIVIIVVAYISVYPKFSGKNLTKIAICDLACSGLALLIVAYKYWGTAVEFDLVFIQLNWFWFTFITYSGIEIPVAYWYFTKKLAKKH